MLRESDYQPKFAFYPWVIIGIVSKWLFCSVPLSFSLLFHAPSSSSLSSILEMRAKESNILATAASCPTWTESIAILGDFNMSSFKQVQRVTKRTMVKLD